MSRNKAIAVFLAFAFAYFLSALIRAITATIAPTLVAEFQLQSADLGLLAGGYFLGFAAMQLPLGKWLDSHGPRKVELLFWQQPWRDASRFHRPTVLWGFCSRGFSAVLESALASWRPSPDTVAGSPRNN